MAEVYPSDNELLNMQSDSETGVILAAKRANDLRVYDEGGLDIGVKSGKFWVGTQLISYAGSSGNTLAAGKAGIYIYLDSSGSLVTNEYSSFPDMTTTPHVRLAVVTTSNGDIDSIVDSRQGHNSLIPYEAGGVKKPVEAHTANDTLTAVESGSVHSNLGAGGTVTLTLPASAAAGTMFTFAVQAAQELRIDPGTATIRDDSGQTADKYKTANAIGECITLVADANGDWATIAKNGTWTEEA
jgi:hypothetical protein